MVIQNFLVSDSGLSNIKAVQLGFKKGRNLEHVRTLDQSVEGSTWSMYVGGLEPDEYVIWYAHLGTNGKWTDWYTTESFYVGVKVTVTQPSQSLWGNTPVISGFATPYGHVQIVRADNNQALSDQATLQSGSNWSRALHASLEPGTYVAKVKHGMSGYPPETYSDPFTFHLRPAPSITLPGANGVIGVSKPVVSGTGEPGAMVYIHKSGDGTTVYGTARVGELRNWSTTLTRDLPQGVYKLSAKQKKDNSESGWKETASSVIVLGVPAITGPGAGTEQEQAFTMTGGSGLGNQNVQVEVLTDATNKSWGVGNVQSNGSWSVALSNLTPGPLSLTVLQKLGAVSTARAAPRTYKIRPPKLQLPTVTYLSFATVKFSGAGYTGALVEISHDGGAGGVQAQGTVVGNNWTAEKTNWLPGTYSMALRQSVSDGAGGRIYSVWGGTPIPVNVPVPPPTAIALTLNGQIPTFTGRGNVWTGQAAARIEVRLNGSTNVLLQTNVATNGTWTVRATAKLPPGTYTVTVLQWMNNLWSTAATAPNLIIKPDLPSVTQPAANASVALTTLFVGATWPDAEVVVRYKDGAEIHKFKSNATTGAWSFNATLTSPGRITVQVQAKFGGQTSGWKDHTFTVKTPVPGITYPQNNDEVGFKLIVRGTNAYPGSTIKVFDATSSSKVLGQTTVLTTGAWAVELEKEFEKEGQQVIYVVQQFGTYPSERSVERTFNVKVGLPIITTPAANARFARRSEVAGTGIPGALVTLKIGTEVIASDIEVGADCHWRRTVNLPTVGPTTMVAEQSYKGGKRASIARVFTVVSNAPVIESPSGGEFVTPAWVVASGAGYPGDTVSVMRDGIMDVIGSFVVDEHGYWSGKLTKTLIGGNPYSLIARSSLGGTTSDWSIVSIVTLLAAGPTLYEPAAGDWVGAQPFYRGLATPGAAIIVASCFDPALVLASTTADANGRWEIQSSQTLPEGAYRVVVRQISGGVVSEWVESGRFMVKKMARDFAAPTVDYPKSGDRVGRKPVMSGSGVPGAYVQIFEADALNELASGFVDREGRWTASFKEALPEEAFTYSVRQLRDEVSSALRPSNQAFTVVQVAANFPGPVITGPQMNEQVEVQPQISGTGMPGARVDVYKHNNLTQVQASAIVNAQGMWSLRLPVLADGPYQMVARQFIDGQFSVYCAPISVTVTTTISPLVVLSPQNNAQVSPRSLIRGTALPGATVNLRKSGDRHTDYGTGVADAQGHWAIVTRVLPVGLFVLNGNVTKTGTASDWMPVNVQLRVVNAG